MFPRRIIFPLLAVVTLFLLACGAVSAAPPPAASEVPHAAQTESASSSATRPAPTNALVPEVVPPSPQPAIPEQRRVTLEFPPQIRAGDSDVIRLTLEVDDLGNVTPTAQVAGHTVTGQTIQFPNLYATHYITAQARLDMAGVDIRPSEMISEPLEPGQSVVFYWSVRPQEVGIYRGTVWLFLQFVDKVSGRSSQIAVSAQPVEIEATSFFGLSADFARMTGTIGSFIGGVVGFPFFKDIVKFIFGRKRNRKSS